MSASLSASTYTWTGEGDGSSWRDSSNWSSGDGTSYPNADDDTAKILSAATITLDADITINELLIPSPNEETSDFSVTISSSTGKTLTVKSKIETFRSAGTGAAADATSTLVLDCDVGSPLLTLHSGGNVTIASGRTAIITNVTKTGGDTPAYTLSVEGTLESTSIDLGSSDSASYSLSVSSSGVVQAASVSAAVGSVKNEGTIELTGDFALSDGNLVSTNSLKANSVDVSGTSVLGGTIDTSENGGKQRFIGDATLSADTVLKSGSGDIQFNGKVNNNYALEVDTSATALFIGTVGTTTALKSFKSVGDGTVDLRGARIKVNGDISFNGPVNVVDSSDTQLEIIAGGTVTSTGVISVEKLLLNSISSSKKGTFDLSSVSHVVSKIACGSSESLVLKTSGDVEVTTLTSVNGNVADGITSSNDIDITSGGNITVSQKMTSASGDVSLDAGTSGTIYLNYECAGYSVVAVDAEVGYANFSGAVVLQKNTNIEAAGGVDFNSTVDGAYTLGFTHLSDIYFNDDVGGTTPLSVLDSWGPVRFDSDASVSTSTGASFNAGFVNGSYLTLTGNAFIKESNTLSDVSIDNSSFGSASTIEFEDGTTQRIGSFSAKGASGNEVTLSSINGEEWKVTFTTSPTNASFEYVVVENSNSTKVLSLFADSATITDSGLSAATPSYTTTNWFSTVFYWIGTNSSSWLNASGGNWAIDEDGANLLPENAYPSYSDGTAQIIISDSAVNELDVSDYASDVKISTLAIGSSSSDITNEKTLVVLGSGNIDCSSSDSSSDLFVNHGVLKFTGAGRIRDSSSALIMDNDSGTVVYSAGSGTVTDYGSDNDTADYHDLVIESGEWTVSGNIKAASSFIVESDGTLELADGGEINSELTNKGTFKTETVASAIWADFTNESGGSVTVNGTLWFAKDCSKIEDKGTWTFGADGIISFYESNDVEFDASEAASSNEYKISAAAETGCALSFVGSSTSPMKISYFVDAAGRTKASSFEYVEFTDDVTFNAAAANTSGSVKFDGDATFASDSDSAFSGSVELASGKTLTNSGGGKVTISDFTENGSSVVNSGNGSITITNLSITSGSPESVFTGGSDSSKAITVSSAEYNSCDLSFDGFVNIVGGTAGNVTNSGTVEITSDSMTISSLSNASGAKLSLSSGTFTVSGATSNDGTIVGGSGAVTFTGNYSGSSGNLTESSTTTEFKGSSVDLSGTVFTKNGGTVVLKPSGASLTLKGKSSESDLGEIEFNNFSAENLGGKTISIDGMISVSGAMTLSGSNVDSLLSIDGEGSIILSSSQDTGEFLRVGTGVTIGIDPGDGSDATTTYTVWNSVPVGAIPYGWVFKLDYYWIGANESIWTDAENWAQKNRDGFVIPVSSAPTLESSNPLYGKCSIYIQQPTVEGNTISNWPELSDDASFAELHVESTTNGSSTVTDDANLYLAGYGLTVSDTFSNTGNIHLYGTQLSSSTPTIVLPADSTEKGTWYFFGNSDGSGTLSDIANLTYKNIIIEGSGNLAANPTDGYSVTAKKLTFNPAVSDSTGSTGATLTLPSDASTISVPSVVLNASGITTTIDASASSAFTISCTDGLSGNGNLTINGGSATVVEIGGAVSLSSGDFKINGGSETSLAGDVALTSGDFECSSATLGLGAEADEISADNIAIESTTVNAVSDETFTPSSGGKITLGGSGALSFNDSGKTISFNGDVEMPSAVAISGNPTFGSESANTVNGTSTLSITGDTTLVASSIATTGAQTYKGTFTANNELALTASAATFTGDATFSTATLTTTGAQDYKAKVVSSAAVDFVAGKIAFGGNVEVVDNVSFELSETAAFSDAAAFHQTGTGKTFTIKSGTVSVGKNAFESGRLFVKTGASFSQTKINTSDGTSSGSELVQSVNGITNYGSCVWDSGSEGGTLSINGDIRGDNASKIVFNKKNVTVDGDLSISGIFYDLTIPAGKSLTNGDGITVRRNLTVDGSYIHNGKTLTLGGVAVDSTTYSSVDGSVNDSAGSDLGDVKVNALVSSTDDAGVTKTFASDFKAAVVDFGTANIIEKLVLGSSDFDFVEFAVPSAVSVPCSVVLASAATVLCSSNTVVFSSTVDSVSGGNFDLTIGSGSDSTVSVFEGKIGLASKIGKFTLYGNSTFKADVAVSGDVTFNADVEFDSAAKKFESDSEISFNGNADSSTALSLSALKIEFNSVEYTASAKQTVTGNEGVYIYLDSDKTWTGEFEFKSPLGIFGPAYSADDPRFSGSDTRFEMVEHGEYSPTGSSATFSGNSSLTFTCDDNFYLNGADFAGLTLSLPENSDSKVTFNPSSSAAAGHWGADGYSAAVFNSTVSNVTVSSDSCVAAASGEEYQNVTDGGGNTSVYGSDGSVVSTKGFAFVAPKITKAYSVYDDVICVEFNVPIENSNGEITGDCAINSSLSSGGAWTDKKTVSLSDGVYSDPDCTTALKNSDSDIKKIYLKTTNSWNTDATGSSSGDSASTNRTGVHKDLTTDLSWLVGLFSAEYGHTMCEGYGKEYGADSFNASFTATEDRCSPVLVGVGTGQELHSKGTAQEYFDSHNFIEFVYSEPVDIGDLAYDAGDVNKQASATFASSAEHGGAITNNASGVTVAGFATIEAGSVKAGFKTSDGNGGWTGGLDSAKPHALYRKFALSAGGTSEIQSHRVRLSVAGYVDESNPIGGYNNYLGYIESAEALRGEVGRISNAFITDKAVDSDGNAIGNGCDGESTDVHPLPTLTVNGKPDSSSAVSFEAGDSSLYTGWDTSAPVFAIYVDGEGSNFTDEDNASRYYEVVGMTNARSATYLYNVEIHLHDNERSVYSDAGYSWLSRKGWQYGGSTVIGTPEYVGGSRMLESQDDVSAANLTAGGIRVSSLDGASGAFSYVSILGSSVSELKSFNTTGITQEVLNNLFFEEGDAASTTDVDGPYIVLPLNAEDQTSQMIARTMFTVYYTPGSEDSPKCFITDLAGNRLVMVDDGDSKKTLQSIDISPPNFTLTLAPIGHDKIDIVFSKELYFKGTKLSELSGGDLQTAMDCIKSNLKISGNASFNMESLEFKGGGSSYTELVATLDGEISLDDIPGTFIELDNSGLTDVMGYQSYIQDAMGNYLENSTKHIISDFAVNAVDVLYAYTALSEGETEEDWFSSKGIYGSSSDSVESDLYTVHDFSADSGNYGKLREGKDIVLMVSYDGDGSSLELIPDLSADVDKLCVSQNINTQLGASWRIWLPELLTSIAPSFNESPLESEFPAAGENDGEWAYTFKNNASDEEGRGWKAGDEVQFLFKIGDTKIDHDGDGMNVTDFYSFSMPESRIAKGDFSFLDLWSFHFGSIKSQRGGVSILNNVINSTSKEETVVKVDMPDDGILNVYVMTLDGNVVRRLAKGRASAGTHYYKWNGSNNAGAPVARGIYFVRVSGKGIDETRKVMVVK